MKCDFCEEEALYQVEDHHLCKDCAYYSAIFDYPLFTLDLVLDDYNIEKSTVLSGDPEVAFYRYNDNWACATEVILNLIEAGHEEELFVAVKEVSPFIKELD